MHVGHLRSTVIGDSLVRIMSFLGHDVIKENHIGDWGRPFGMLIEHLLDLGEDVAAAGLTQGDLDGFYKEANAKFAASEEFQDRARERVVLLQGGDPETPRLWHRLVEMSTALLQRGVRQARRAAHRRRPGRREHVPAAHGRDVERLDAAGLLVEDDGAQVVFPPGFDEPRRRPTAR